jgi:hypothetical protein
MFLGIPRNILLARIFLLQKEDKQTLNGAYFDKGYMIPDEFFRHEIDFTFVGSFLFRPTTVIHIVNFPDQGT